MLHYIFLLGAIACELAATTCLKLSQGFTVWWASAVTVVLYSISFYMLSQVMLFIPLSVAYALWSGLGILATVLISVYFFHEPLQLITVVGILLILVGVVIVTWTTK